MRNNTRYFATIQEKIITFVMFPTCCKDLVERKGYCFFCILIKKISFYYYTYKLKILSSLINLLSLYFLQIIKKNR